MEWFRSSADRGKWPIVLMFLFLLALAGTGHVSAASEISLNSQVVNTYCEWTRVGGRRLLHCDAGETLARLQHREALAAEITMEKVVEPEVQNPSAAVPLAGESPLLITKEETIEVQAVSEAVMTDQPLAAHTSVDERQTPESIALRFMVMSKADHHLFLELVDDGAIPVNEVNYVQLTHAPYAGKMSFGIFSHVSSAEARQAEILNYGIPTVIVDRFPKTKDRIASLD